MIRSKFSIGVIAVIFAGSWSYREVSAQLFSPGFSSNDAQYSGSSSLDSNGRAANADGRVTDRYGYPIDDYGRSATRYRTPSHSASGYYYPGGYSGLTYSNGIGYSVGVGGYSGGFDSNAGRYAPGAGTSGTYVAPPRTIAVGGVYNSRTVMNNSTRGGSIEYTNNGNGYIYSPGTSSQTVISSGPSIFPSISVVQPSQPPVIIQSQPIPSISKPLSGSSSVRASAVNPMSNNGQVKLVCPKEAPAPLTYVLNGTTYSIKPGYSQTFAADRAWVIEFLRTGSGSQPLRYDLRAGTYQFTADANGWDLAALPANPVPALSPPPLASVQAPAPSPMSPPPTSLSPPPTPLSAPPASLSPSSYVPPSPSPAPIPSPGL